MIDRNNPATVRLAVTPGTAALTKPARYTTQEPDWCRALYVGTSGDLVVDDGQGGTVTISNAAVGYHPISVTYVYAATSAEGIVALW